MIFRLPSNAVTVVPQMDRDGDIEFIAIDGYQRAARILRFTTRGGIHLVVHTPADILKELGFQVQDGHVALEE